MKELCDFANKAAGGAVVHAELGLTTPDGTLAFRTLEQGGGDGAAPFRLLLDHAGVFTDELLLKLDGGAVVCERRIKNATQETQRLTEARLTVFLKPFGEPKDDYFYHAENPRIYNRYAIGVDTARGPEMVATTSYDAVGGNQWIDPYDAGERIGYSPYQPFPALLLSNFGTRRGLVHGTLSQRTFFHHYLARHEGGELRLDILSGLKAVDYREVRPGETLEDRWYLGTTQEADDFQRLFADYLRVLRKHLPPLYGATDINRHAVVWGSWNDGIGRDIDQGRLLAMADFIAKELPTVKWMQIDDGYAEHAGKLRIAHGLGAPYEADGGTDLRKFPDNLAGFAAQVRARGVEPALWIGGFVPAEAPLARERPDWLLDYSVRPVVKQVNPLDVSKPEVRDYMREALDFFFVESGFRGMKHDFWSYAFEDSRIRLANRDKSGYEWRSWWLHEIRQRLPETGYLQTGCDIVMGNPFLAEHFTNYRYGIDIGSGNWEHVSATFLWGAACFALGAGDLFVPNSDAIGLLPGLSDSEALFCINFCLVSRSMVEVGGWLHQNPGHPRMRWVKKALCCPNNGQQVRFANFDYRGSPDQAPGTWYLETPHFSLLEGSEHLPLRTVAVFNLDDTAKTVRVDFASLGLPGGDHLATDVWTLETRRESGGMDVRLEGRSSALFGLSRADAPGVLDANVKVDAVEVTPRGLAVEFAHPGELELLLNFRPANFAAEARGPAWLLRHQLKEPGRLELVRG